MFVHDEIITDWLKEKAGKLSLLSIPVSVHPHLVDLA